MPLASLVRKMIYQPQYFCDISWKQLQCIWVSNYFVNVFINTLSRCGYFHGQSFANICKIVSK